MAPSLGQKILASLGTLDDSTMSKKEQGYAQPEYAKMTA
jgi:hypothetical protein